LKYFKFCADILTFVITVGETSTMTYVFLATVLRNMLHIFTCTHIKHIQGES